LDDDLQRSNVNNTKGGWIGGVQGGYNWQTNCTVWGFEADYNWTRLNASSFDTDGDFVPAFIDSLSVSSRLRGIGTLRTRAGVVVDNLLIYLTGGLAYASFDRTYTQTDNTFSETLTQTRTRWGWTAGFGTEWAFNQNWSIKSEVLYARFEKDESSFTCAVITCGVARTIRFDNEDSVWTTKIGVNYRFGGYGPVAARY
jgi:outer membrane immunogenic protein